MTKKLFTDSWTLLGVFVLAMALSSCGSSAPASQPETSAASVTWAGITVTDLPGELRSALNVGGVYVTGVSSEEDAAGSAELLQGDIITVVNDTPVSDVASFQAALQGAKGNGVVLTLYGGVKVRVGR